MQNINRIKQGPRRPQPSVEASLDNWLHAVALVILRRQMRGRWMTGMESDSTAI